MDELTRDLALAETVAASDARNNTLAILEEASQGACGPSTSSPSSGSRSSTTR